MNRLSIAAAFALLVAPQFASSTEAAPPARIARHGTLQVTAQFTMSSTFTTPVRCSATANPNADARGATTEAVVMTGQQLTFNGQTATCTLSLDYNFDNIDPISGITVTLDVSTDTTATFVGRDLNTGLVVMDRSWSMIIGQPANGDTAVNFGALVL